MRRFAQLYKLLDQSTATLDKRAALVEYFKHTPPADAAWGLWLLCGGKLRSIANTRELREWASEETGYPLWLIEQSYAHVGDLAETLSLLLPKPTKPLPDISLTEWIEKHILPLAKQAPEARRELIINAWRGLSLDECLLFNKLLTGSLRVGVSQRMAQQALAELSGVDIALIAQRMLGNWTPHAEYLAQILSQEVLPSDSQQPYPFFLASPLEADIASLGPIEDWLLEWKWDGIRIQLIRRNNQLGFWSRGEERLDGRFPEIEEAASKINLDYVIDGELLAWTAEKSEPLPFTALQKRIGRLKPGAKLIVDIPARVLAYDLLELEGTDLRNKPLCERRALLASLLKNLNDPRIQLSPRVEPSSWEIATQLRDESRERGVEGFMLKRLQSIYQVGRRRGDWWKWKINPLTVDAVLLYAQAGHGRRSNLYTDYTFGLWRGEELVPVAKAYSGLDDKEISDLDKWIRSHTVERFGPVRAVQPIHVFELGFEAVHLSNRHKSGIAVRFPRILRWRHDKAPPDADQLDALQALAR